MLRVGGAGVLALWLAGLVAFSTVLYQRNNLTADFATYNQAWTLIGHGHLNPYSTIYTGYPFLKSDFELILWPLALVHLVIPQPIVLLWIQDLAVAASAFVVYVWILDFLESRNVGWRAATGVGAVVLTALVVNPGVYQTLLFDFHMEPLSTVFVLLAGRDIWSGRRRRAWLWVGLVLLFGSFAAITLVGLGLSAVLAGGATRRQGLAVGVIGLAWVGLISLLGANAGSGIDNYAYLAGRATLPHGTGAALVVAGILAHPSRPLHLVTGRLHFLWVLLKPAGVIGLASAWGFGVPAVVLLVNVLNVQEGFIFQAFQNFVVFPFVLLGTVMVLVWLAEHLRWGRVVAIVVGLAVTAQAVVYGLGTSPGNVRWAVDRVSAATGAQLNKALARTPADAEVIATIGIMGRFSGRPAAYWFSPGGSYPVSSRPVVFVFDPANENTIPNANPADDRAGAEYVRTVLHARPLVERDGVAAFVWSPPPGTSRLTFPAPVRVPGG